MIYESVAQIQKMLSNLNMWLEAGAKRAEEIGFPVDNLLDARLAPDMYTLRRQVQGTCDAAKFSAARLTGETAPSHEDGDATFEELQARIQETIDFMDGIGREKYDDAPTRMLNLPWFSDQEVPAIAYFFQFAQPNFYFHLVTAYGILRHNGVPVGKLDYIGKPTP